MLTVYLDSLDYSNLSVEDISPEAQAVKTKVMEFARSKQVAFCFSALSVCEAAPSNVDAVSYAIRRGDFLSGLCASNALLDPFSLLEAEVRALGDGVALRRESVLTSGRWFPQVELEEPARLPILKEVLAEQAELQGLSRQARRALERKVIKNGEVRKGYQQLADANPGEATVREICARYPMKPQSARVLRDFVMGRGNREVAQRALEESMEDPCWLMRWLASNPELAPHLTEIVRRPGREIGGIFRVLVQEVAENRQRSQDMGQPLQHFLQVQRMLMDTKLNEMIVRLIRRLAGEWRIHLPVDISPERIAQFCPGLDAMFRSAISALWTNIGGSRKELPSDSQFPDSMHALYGPYIDIFRADRFMAPHIDKQLMRHGTATLPKLSLLLGEIERRLDAA